MAGGFDFLYPSNTIGGQRQIPGIVEYSMNKAIRFDSASVDPLCQRGTQIGRTGGAARSGRSLDGCAHGRLRHTEVFASPAALEGLHRAVVVTLGAGLYLSVFHNFIHIKKSPSSFCLVPCDRLTVQIIKCQEKYFGALTKYWRCAILYFVRHHGNLNDFF